MKRTLLSFLIILCTALAVQAQPAPVYTLKSCLEQSQPLSRWLSDYPLFL